MIWVLGFLGIALVGLLGLVAYAVWLWHKAEDVMSELDMVGSQVEEILGLLDQIKPLDAHRSTGSPELTGEDRDGVESEGADLSFDPEYVGGFPFRFANARH